MWQWYIHSPGRSSGSQAIRTVVFCGTLTVSFQAGGAVSEYLEEEPVQVEGMVLARLVDELPDLKLADADVVVALAVATVHQRFHAHGSRRLGPVVRQRRDLAQRRPARARDDASAGPTRIVANRSRLGSPRPRS